MRGHHGNRVRQNMGWIMDLTLEEIGKGVKLKCFEAAWEAGGSREARDGILGRQF
jgi:hypothetical protein